MTNPVAKLSFWGVRGSTATVDPATWRLWRKHALRRIDDAGRDCNWSWIVAPGCGIWARVGARIKNIRRVIHETHFLVTHYHWDHIQGIPFFTPLYSDQNEFHFYSFRSEFLGRDSLKQVFETQMAQPYFPVDLSAMNAKRRFQEVADGDAFYIGENRVSVRALNHPQGCLGFRIETAAGTVVYATDNEPGNPELDKSLRELAAGADIFINDAQYTPEQLAGAKRGWGHSSWKEGVKVGARRGREDAGAVSSRSGFDGSDGGFDFAAGTRGI